MRDKRTPKDVCGEESRGRIQEVNENEVGSSLEAGTRDQPLRTSAWEASLDAVCVQTDKSLINLEEVAD